MDKAVLKEVDSGPDYGLTRRHMRTYRCYADMRARCLNPNNKAYKRYGARGIKVCARWLESFRHFLNDMGEAPPGLMLDRIDNDGNYEPINCRWVGWDIQANNRSTNRMVTLMGRTQTVAQWAREVGVEKGVISSRIKGGWPEHLIVSPQSFQAGKSVRPRGGNKRRAMQ